MLFNVYGEPAGQTAVDDWFALDLWHLMLTQQGYAVITLDNRGTPSLRGRDWRKSIYRKIGVLATDDQAGAARTIGRWPWVDSTRFGIWGWSGGGSMTLNLMFRTPGVYATGMAVAPVPDVHLYDTIYRERYMGLPSENEADYQRSSPLTFAHQLRGNLLIVHGSGDGVRRNHRISRRSVSTTRRCRRRCASHRRRFARQSASGTTPANRLSLCATWTRSTFR